jgi:hypothetical protein
MRGSLFQSAQSKSAPGRPGTLQTCPGFFALGRPLLLASLPTPPHPSHSSEPEAQHHPSRRLGRADRRGALPRPWMNAAVSNSSSLASATMNVSVLVLPGITLPP